jgi:tetrapyrrole methylase family protein/MazG family protein
MTECPETINQFQRLLDIMRTLRSPGGCSWDREQTFTSMRKYVLEEAQEVAEAIDENDPMHVCEELGDLSMIVVFLAQIAAEEGVFSIKDSLRSINDKLVSRHPHVFAEKNALSSSTVVEQWQDIKKQERASGDLLSQRMRRLLGYASPMHATIRIQDEAAHVGFDFPDLPAAIGKISEEGAEILRACHANQPEQLREELGDMLFSMLNVARMAGFNPETLLKEASGKFVNRFAAMEEQFADQGGLTGKTAAEMDQAWEKAKHNSREASSGT